MKFETDSSVARKYIKENNDKLERIEIINNLCKMTNLNRRTIQSLYNQVNDLKSIGEEKIAGKDGQSAKKFIIDNKGKMTDKEMINHIAKNTRLNELSAEAILYVVKNEEISEKKKKATEEKILYKVRKKNVFMIDDSKLYRKVQG